VAGCVNTKVLETGLALCSKRIARPVDSGQMGLQGSKHPSTGKESKANGLARPRRAAHFQPQVHAQQVQPPSRVHKLTGKLQASPQQGFADL